LDATDSLAVDLDKHGPRRHISGPLRLSSPMKQRPSAMKQPPHGRPEHRANRYRAIFPTSPLTPFDQNEWRFPPAALGKADAGVAPPSADNPSEPANAAVRPFCVGSVPSGVRALDVTVRVRWWPRREVMPSPWTRWTRSFRH